MPDTTETKRIDGGPTPGAEQPFPGTEADLVRIIEQLDTIIYLLRKPERDEAERKRKEQEAAESILKTLRDYGSELTDE
jgi:hypothetical protein